MVSVITSAFTDALLNAARRAESRHERCSDFAVRVRQMGAPFPGPFGFHQHPWTREMHDASSRIVVVEKSAQMGFTETGINRALFDVVVRGRDVLYVLPDDDMAGKFSSGRVDAAIELSPFLRDHFTDVSNVGHKRAGSVNLYVCGSRSKSNLKSTPCANLTLDELNEMHEGNVELVFERVSGYPEDQVTIAMFSTPTIPDFGVSEFIKASSQCRWTFRCPYCSKFIELDWPRNFRIDHESPGAICHLCNHVLEGEAKRRATEAGEWVPAYPARHERCAGYHGLSQLYSNTVTAPTIQDLYEKAQIKTSAEQQFYNSKMGQPHVAKGASLSVQDVQACYGSYRSANVWQAGTTMGVDVGKWYHWVASEWSKVSVEARDDEPMSWRRKVVAIGRCMGTQELARAMDLLNTRRAVIDCQPETREIKRLQDVRKMVWGGWVKEITDTLRVRESMRQVDCNRTEWLDVVFDRVRAGRALLELPSDAGSEFEAHLQAPKRVYLRDAKGDETAHYQSGASADHYAFAMLFDEVAHHLSFIGRRPVETTAATAVKKPMARDPREVDATRYADKLLERLTGFKRSDQ